MSDMNTQDGPEERKTSRFLAILLIVALFLPHTLEITRVSQPDNSIVRFTMFAVFWMISLENGSTIAGPYSSTLLAIPSVLGLVLSVLFLPLNIFLIIAYSRFTKGTFSKRSIIRAVGITLITQTFILFAFFWYQLDGWAFGQAYPLPILHALIVLSVVQQSDTESMVEPGLQDLSQKPRSEFSVRDTVSDSIIMSCFWCVFLVFLTGGILFIFSFFSARLFQPDLAFSQLLMGLGFLAIAIVVVIIRLRSEYGR